MTYARNTALTPDDTPGGDTVKDAITKALGSTSAPATVDEIDNIFTAINAVDADRAAGDSDIQDQLDVLEQAQWATALPDQAGNGGKFVTTDGTDASWGDIPVELPDQTGKDGQALFTDGTNPFWGALIMKREAKTGAFNIAQTDKGTLFDVTSGTFTATFSAASTFEDGWYCYIKNSGTGEVTLDPDSSETIDALSSFKMYPFEMRLLIATGSAFFSYVIHPFYAIFTSSGTFTKPPGYARFCGLLWGAGGGGGKGGDATYNSGGGGGGACVPFDVQSGFFSETESVTIAAGGTGSATQGVAASKGGNSSISTITGYGGGGGLGLSGAGVRPGTGGGALGAGSNGNSGTTGSLRGGHPSVCDTNASTGGGLSGNSGFGGGGASTAGQPTNGYSFYGGACAGATNFAWAGSSFYGGGGGGGGYDEATNTGGTSVIGGNGGNGKTTSSGVDGSAPGGGGGATRTGTKGGDGARGELRIWGVV